MTTVHKFLLPVMIAVCMALNANALTITPASSPRWQGSLPWIPKADDIENITGTDAELSLAYKSNLLGFEAGPFAGSYNTSYDPPYDPMYATLTHVNQRPAITGTPIFLVLNDGFSNPIWYIFDISRTWNGTETINMNDFWPNKGAILQVSIYTGESRTSVPEAGSTVALLALAVSAIGFLRRKLA